MKSIGLMMIAAGVVGCSTLPVSGDGIVELEITVPKNLTVAANDSVTLHARALDINGDEVAAAIRWFTTDTLIIAVDSITGTVHPIAASGTGRVQAGVGSLRSDVINISIQVTAP